MIKKGILLKHGKQQQCMDF